MVRVDFFMLYTCVLLEINVTSITFTKRANFYRLVV